MPFDKKATARRLYSLLLYLALPLIGARLLWRAWRAPAYARRACERFALKLPPLARGGIWLHAVSVGESIAAAPLVEALLQRYADLPLTVTCMTPTGSERIRALFGSRVQHCYLPYDLPFAARRFIDLVQPKLAVLMETELWPNHIHQCARRGIPVVLANARLSARSAKGYARFGSLTRAMLGELNWIAAQNCSDAERFAQLGAAQEKISVAGSIKFDLKPPANLQDHASALRQHWQAQSRPLWIAASTHDGEDDIVLAAHKILLQSRPQTLLILVPRHPERFNAVYQLCQRQGFAVKRRSSGEAVEASTQVLLGDSMGELLFLYALADVALVGGSLVPHGGHNLLEPAALGKPLLSGPHVFNFADIAAQLEQAGALQTVTDAPSLAAALERLWDNPKQSAQMQSAALDVLRQGQGALARLLSGMDNLLNPHKET